MNEATAHQLGRIYQERRRHDQLLRDGKIPWDCADPEVATSVKLAVLGEEVGEVNRAYLEEGNLVEELIQVAAVAVAIAESLEPDAESPSKPRVCSDGGGHPATADKPGGGGTEAQGGSLDI